MSFEYHAKKLLQIVLQSNANEDLKKELIKAIKNIQIGGKLLKQKESHDDVR